MGTHSHDIIFGRYDLRFDLTKWHISGFFLVSNGILVFTDLSCIYFQIFVAVYFLFMPFFFFFLIGG